MPDIVLFDPATGRVTGHRPSQDPAAWKGRSDALIVASAPAVADLRALVESVSTRYLRVEGGAVVPLTDAERAAQDAADQAAAEAAVRAETVALMGAEDSTPRAVRALAIVINNGLNEIRVKVGLPTRSIPDAMAAIRNLIETGQV